MLKDWKDLRIGEKIHFCGKDFDGSWDKVCTVIEIKDDYVIADYDGIRLRIDDWSKDMFRR